MVGGVANSVREVIQSNLFLRMVVDIFTAELDLFGTVPVFFHAADPVHILGQGLIAQGAQLPHGGTGVDPAAVLAADGKGGLPGKTALHRRPGDQGQQHVNILPSVIQVSLKIFRDLGRPLGKAVQKSGDIGVAPAHFVQNLIFHFPVFVVALKLIGRHTGILGSMALRYPDGDILFCQSLLPDGIVEHEGEGGGHIGRNGGEMQEGGLQHFFRLRGKIVSQKETIVGFRVLEGVKKWPFDVDGALIFFESYNPAEGGVTDVDKGKIGLRPVLCYGFFYFTLHHQLMKQRFVITAAGYYAQMLVIFPVPDRAEAGGQLAVGFHMLFFCQHNDPPSFFCSFL